MKQIADEHMEYERKHMVKRCLSSSYSHILITSQRYCVLQLCLQPYQDGQKTNRFTYMLHDDEGNTSREKYCEMTTVWAWRKRISPILAMLALLSFATTVLSENPVW